LVTKPKETDEEIKRLQGLIRELDKERDEIQNLLDEKVMTKEEF
jgi:hypothetical protein